MSASQDDLDDWLYDAKDVPTAAQVLDSAPAWLRRRDPHIVRALSQGRTSEARTDARAARGAD